MVEIKEVITKKEWKQFVSFPLKLYKGNNNYTPPLLGDDLKDFNPKKNPSYERCETKCFLAYKDKKIVGRICALYNPVADDKYNTKRMRFRHFDFIDDLEVSKALIKAARDFGLQKGLKDVEGPNGFTDFDKEGMLIEGFDRPNIFITYYNAPYYLKHMEALGFKKQVDWVEYTINIPQEKDPRLNRIADLVLRKGYKVLHFKSRKEVMPYVQKAFKMYNRAFCPLYGTVELSEELVEYYMGSFLPLLNYDYISIVLNKKDEVVGFAAVIPSLSKAVQKSHGKLFPTGWIHLLHALHHNDTIDMLLIAVDPACQGLGVNAVLIRELLNTCIKYGIKYAETGPELELNEKVQSQWKEYDGKITRRRRLFISDLDKIKVE